MRIKMLIGMLLALGMLCMCTSAQVKGFPRSKYVVDPKFPSVYILQEKASKRSNAQEAEISQRTFFRLYNNLKWPIRLTVSTAPQGHGDVQLDYELLDDKDKVVGGYECHVCTMIPLSAGRNVSFSLPHSEVEANTRVRVEFSFWWESSQDIGTEKEAFHFILFTFEGKP